MRSEHDLRLLGAACCGWGVLAVLLALRASATEVLVVALAAAALGGALFLSRVRRALVVGVAFCAVVTALIATAAGGQLAHQRQGPLAELAAERASGTFEAVVTGQPRALEPKGPGAAETRYLVPLTVHRVQARGTRVDVATPVVLIGDGRWRTVPWRARLDVKGRLAPSERLGSAQALLVARFVQGIGAASAGVATGSPTGAAGAAEGRFDHGVNKSTPEAPGVDVDRPTKVA